MGKLLDFLSGAFPFRELFPSRVLEQLVEAETCRIRLAEKHFITELRISVWFGLRPFVIETTSCSEIGDEVAAVQRELRLHGRRLSRMRARSGTTYRGMLSKIEQDIDKTAEDFSGLTQAYDRLGERIYSVEQWKSLLVQCHYDFLRFNASNPALDVETRCKIGEAMRADPTNDVSEYLEELRALAELILSQALQQSFYVEAVSILMNGTRSESRLLKSRIEWIQDAIDSHSFYCATGNLETVIALLDDVERTLKEEGGSREVFKRIMSARERLSRGFGILADASKT